MSSTKKLTFNPFEEAIDTFIKETGNNDYTRTICIGTKGIGKTTLIPTMVKPVLHHVFDPTGSQPLTDLALNPAESGIIVDRRFELKDSSRSVEIYQAWEQEKDRLDSQNFWPHIGTYVFDSTSTFSKMMYDVVAAGRGAKAAGGMMDKRGYGILSNYTVTLMQWINSLPCHVVVFGHISQELHEATGEMLYQIALQPSLRDKVPLLFSDYYHMVYDKDREPEKRSLIVSPSDGRIAGTRIGGLKYDKTGNIQKNEDGSFATKFEEREVPNFKTLWKKAGLNVEDKDFSWLQAPTEK
jgi:hypothetical protein